MGLTFKKYAFRNGAERSGLFCVLANLVEQLHLYRSVDVLQTVLNVRYRRSQVVPCVVSIGKRWTISSCCIHKISNIFVIIICNCSLTISYNLTISWYIFLLNLLLIHLKFILIDWLDWVLRRIGNISASGGDAWNNETGQNTLTTFKIERIISYQSH